MLESPAQSPPVSNSAPSALSLTELSANKAKADLNKDKDELKSKILGQFIKSGQSNKQLLSGTFIPQKHDETRIAYDNQLESKSEL